MSFYLTVKTEATGEFTEKKSRFIGTVCPVQTEEAAQIFIKKMKKEHHAATHNCFAFILRKDGIKRYSDDGEPQGTAGIPILEVLERQGLLDVVVVVTRYFGGTLLGAGGLVRAYSKGAVTALKNAPVIQLEKSRVLEIKMDYSFYGTFENMLSSYRVLRGESLFLEEVTVSVTIPEIDVERFQKELAELFAGRVSARECETIYGEFEEVE